MALYRQRHVGNRLRGRKCMKNRSDIEIMASILRAAKGKWEYKTTIMNNAAVSHSQLIRYLAIALERRLVEFSEVRDLYRITETGLVFLDKYIGKYFLFLNKGLISFTCNHGIPPPQARVINKMGNE